MSVRKNILLAALAGCLSVSCASSAATWKPAPFRIGQQRLAIGTNSFSQKTTETEPTPGTKVKNDEDVLALNASYGYFYQPNVEIGGMLTYGDADVAGIKSTLWIVNGYLRYWIDTRANTRPFLQGRVGIGNRDDGTADDDLLEYGLGAGLSDFLSQSTSLDLLLEWATREYDNSNEQTDGLELSVFLSVYF